MHFYHTLSKCPYQIKKMHKQRNTNNTLTKKLISAKYQIYKKNIKKQEKILCLSLGQGL